jgi:hypothetical protein
MHRDTHDGEKGEKVKGEKESRLSSITPLPFSPLPLFLPSHFRVAPHLSYNATRTR